MPHKEFHRLRHNQTGGDNDREEDAGAVRPSDKGNWNAINGIAENAVTFDAAAIPCAPATYATDTSPASSAATLS